MNTQTDTGNAPAGSDFNGYYRLTRVLPVIAVMAAIYGIAALVDYHINAVLLTIVVMIALCLLRVPVPIALISAALLGALHAGMDTNTAIGALNDVKIGNLNHGNHQSRQPEQVVMGKQRQKRQDTDKLDLGVIGMMGQPFRQGMQAQIKSPQPKHPQNDRPDNNHEQHIRLSGPGNEERRMCNCRLSQ